MEWIGVDRFSKGIKNYFTKCIVKVWFSKLVFDPLLNEKLSEHLRMQRWSLIWSTLISVYMFISPYTRILVAVIPKQLHTNIHATRSVFAGNLRFLFRDNLLLMITTICRLAATTTGKPDDWLVGWLGELVGIFELVSIFEYQLSGIWILCNFVKVLVCVCAATPNC